MKDGRSRQWTSGQAAGALKDLAADEDVAAQIVEVGGLMALEELARTDALKSGELAVCAARREGALERVTTSTRAEGRGGRASGAAAAEGKVKKSGVAIGLDIARAPASRWPSSRG